MKNFLRILLLFIGLSSYGQRFNAPVVSKHESLLNEQRTTMSQDGIRFNPLNLSYTGYLNASGIIGNRSWNLPNADGTISLISQSITNGVLTKSPSEDKVFDELALKPSLSYVDRPAIRTVTSSTNLTPSDKTLNISSGTFTVTINTAIGFSGITYQIVNSGSGIITLDPNGTETINGVLTLIVPSQSGYTIKSDGSNWVIIDKFRQESLNRTQWSQNISNTTIADGTSLNILTLIPNNSKVSNGTDGGINELNIAFNGIIINWHGTPMTHEIRVIYTLSTGTDQNYNMELRRIVDDSVIGTAQIDRNSDTGIATAIFSTYTGSSTDPFVVNGFYIAFRNNSGASVDITTNLNLFITSYFR